MSSTRRNRTFQVVATLSILIVGIVIGRLSTLEPQSHAQDRQQDGTERRSFLSGGARSELVLNDMSETLKRIETRLESMEGIMKAHKAD